MSDEDLHKKFPAFSPELREKLREIVHAAYVQGVEDGQRSFLSIVSRTDMRVQHVVAEARRVH